MSAYLLAAGLVVLAIAERKAFEFAAETVTKKEVLYTPHITARLIVDGPGLAYLNDVCPRDDLATCALHEALSWSDDPYRLTATHIIFERSENLGSFRLMPIEDQQAVGVAGDRAPVAAGVRKRRWRRRATERQLAQRVERPGEPGVAVAELRGVAAELLAQCQWRRILGVGASDLDDLVEGRDDLVQFL